MSTIVGEGIEIYTDTGFGIPSTYVNNALGLRTGGVFAWATGRLGLDGTKTIAGDTTRTVWDSNIIADGFAAEISRTANFNVAGCMEAVSDLNIPIVNVSGFQKTLKANGVSLARRVVKYYKIRSADMITFTFELRWSGVVDETPFNPLTQNIRCLGNAMDIFRSVPVIPVSEVLFGKSPAASRDKMIPIVLGRSAYSPLVNVAKAGEKEVLNVIDGVSYTVAAIMHSVPSITVAGFGRHVYLLTRGITFVADDGRLVGKFLSIIAGGRPQNVRIKSNSATFVTPGLEYSDTTNVDTEDLIDLTDVVNWDQTVSGGDGVEGVWYAEVVDLIPTFAASTRQIKELKSNSQGRPALALWKSDRNVFDDVSEMHISKSEYSINDCGFPGYSILAGSAGTDGSLYSFYNIPPVVLYRANNMDSDNFPTAGDPAPYLYSRVISSNHYTAAFVSGPRTQAVAFQIILPGDEILKQFDELYILPDLTVSAPYATVSVSIWAMDFYGRRGDLIVDAAEIYADPISGSISLKFLPGAYYSATRNDETFFANKIKFNVASILGDTKKAKAYNSVYFQIDFNSEDITVDFYQIGVVGKRAVGVTSETVYGRVLGETYGNIYGGMVWEGRKDFDGMVDNPVDYIEAIVRQYDEPAPQWYSGKTQVIGDQIRSRLDNGHIFVCTSPGVTHANTEPSWTTTPGQVYADGSCTWKELRKIPIDTAAFDIASAQRAGWFGGRTLVDKKKSLEYITELLRQAFLIGMISKDGLFKVKAWRENDTPLVTFDKSNIVNGSISGMGDTPLSDAFNEFRILYDENHGAGKMNRQLFVTNIDKPAFPSIAQSSGVDTVMGVNTIAWDNILDTYFQALYPAPHGLVVGDYISLTGNADGFDFPPRQVINVISTTIIVVDGHVTTATPSSSGTVYKSGSTVPLWATYVAGISDYTRAKAIWEDANAGYVEYKAVNPLPDEYGECRFFIDPYAKDAAGGYIWSVDGTTATLELDVGDDHAAVFSLENYAAWTPKRKKQPTFEIEDSAANAVWEIGDPVAYNYATITDGAELGWISEITMVPGDENAAEPTPPRLRIGLTMDPT